MDRLLLVLMVFTAPVSCLLDAGSKHRCQTDSDCASGRVCMNRVCESQRGTKGGNYVFVTSESFVPAFQSLNVADDRCNGAARAAGLPGTYRAWLSTTDIAARDRLQGARGWIRPDGAPFADTVVDIVRGRIFFPPLVDEHGQQNRGGVLVATGTTADGTAGQNCFDWTDQATSRTVVGSTEGTMAAWTTLDDVVPCDQSMHLYCFGVDLIQEVAPTAVPGRTAFLSHGPFQSAGGAPAADAFCNQEADYAKIPGAFVALLATSTSTAAARVSAPTSSLWVRLDGVPLNDAGQNLFDTGPTVAPLNLSSRGVYLSIKVLAGAATPREMPSASETCHDWTSTIKEDSVVIGYSSHGPGWFGGSPGDCSRQYAHIYCLQN